MTRSFSCDFSRLAFAFAIFAGAAALPADARADGAEETTAQGPANATGTLSINAMPASRVILDGKDVGTTPLLQRNVAAGSHRVRLTTTDGKVTRLLQLEVTGGRTTAVARRMTGAAPSPATRPAGGVFNRDAAAAALASVDVSSCAAPGTGEPTGTGHVRLKFRSDGKVAEVTITAPYAGTATGTCVEKRFAAVSIPPFAASAAVTVGKSFVIPGPQSPSPPPAPLSSPSPY